MTDEITLDLAEIRTVAEFHDRVAAVMKFPHYYGRNLDAFWDCLTDIFDPVRMRLLHFDANTPQELEPYFRMFKDYEEETGGKFSVVFE